MKHLFLPVYCSLAFMSVAACNHPNSTSAPAVATPSTTTSASQNAPDQITGHWIGGAKVIVQWAKQKDLRVDLVVAPDGRVTGSVGDAKLVDAKLRRQSIGSPYRVHGTLEGNLIDAEGIRRDAVDVLFHPEDGTLVGGLHSSGTPFGGKEAMRLSASDMVLRRSAN